MSSREGEVLEAAQSKTKNRNAYMACVNCRRKKTKCEFATARATPPCIKCYRERKECVFVPGRRGGRRNIEKHSSSPPKAAQPGEHANIIASTFIKNPSDAYELLARTYPRNPENKMEERSVSDFPLIKENIIDIYQLHDLVSKYFLRHHQFMPIYNAVQVPCTNEFLLGLCEERPFLLMAMVTVASQFEALEIHVSCWKFLKATIMDLAFGREAKTDVVEGLLLLAENVPHEIEEEKSHIHESRMTWNLVGMAIRFGYYIELDQKTLLSSSELFNYQTQRDRLVWTYCYIQDRHASIRLGRTFWSRGPGLCFQNPDVNEFSDSRVNFPTLLPLKEGDEDYALLTQAYIELTQILTNVHDLLYPSRDRTISLVQVGGYYRILDEFTRTFSEFEIRWRPKKWKTFPTTEALWATFYYAKLYAYAFAFQAHVHRAITKHKNRQTSDDGSLSNIIFPKGLGGSPDAKFILESAYAAENLLLLAVDKFCPNRGLIYLPARYFGFFSYASVFLLKVVFTRAVGFSERKRFFTLTKRLVQCLFDVSAQTNLSTAHPTGRLALQLKTLMKRLILTDSSPIDHSPFLSDDKGAMDQSSRPVSPDPTLPDVDDNIVYLQEIDSLLAADLDYDMWWAYLGQNLNNVS